METSKKRILLVDDDVGLARSASRALSLEFDVDVYLQGEAALRALCTKSYNCIVSDMDMNPMNGLQFYYEAIKLRPDMADHFLFHTANSNPPPTPAPLMRKPADMQELRDRVRSLAS